MKKSSFISLLLGSMIASFATADISREAFIDQLDSANCSQVPPDIYINTSAPQYDFANALSLSWITLAGLSDKHIEKEELAKQWQLSDIDIIENAEHDIKIMMADYQSTLLVTFSHAGSNKDWLYNTGEDVLQPNVSFALNEKTHHDFSNRLSSEWDTLINTLTKRIGQKKLWVFGHGVGAAFAQLSAAGFESEGIEVNQVYLSGAPKVGSQAWVFKANQLLEGRVHRLIFRNDLIAQLPINHEARNDFQAIADKVPDFIANMLARPQSTIRFDALGQQISLDSNANYTHWNESDSLPLEQQYWHLTSDDLARAKINSSNPITRVNKMTDTVVSRLEDHRLRSEDGYFCAMISVLENEY